MSLRMWSRHDSQGMPQARLHCILPYLIKAVAVI